jgi:hypothetical protein
MHLLDGRPLERCCSRGCDICEGAPLAAPDAAWLRFIAECDTRGHELVRQGLARKLLEIAKRMEGERG